MVLGAVIPVVNLAGVPFGPFIGGYYGILSVRNDRWSFAAKSLAFGCLLGLLVLLVLVVVAVALTLTAGPKPTVYVPPLDWRSSLYPVFSQHGGPGVYVPPATGCSGRRRGIGCPLSLIKTLRPQQWVKNGLVFLPFVFAIQQAWSPDDLDPVPGLIARLLAVFAAFCALSGAVYLLNDLSDKEEDRRHAVKRFRPIASGNVGVPMAAVRHGSPRRNRSGRRFPD